MQSEIFQATSDTLSKGTHYYQSYMKLQAEFERTKEMLALKCEEVKLYKDKYELCLEANGKLSHLVDQNTILKNNVNELEQKIIEQKKYYEDKIRDFEEDIMYKSKLLDFQKSNPTKQYQNNIRNIELEYTTNNLQQDREFFVEKYDKDIKVLESNYLNQLKNHTQEYELIIEQLKKDLTNYNVNLVNTENQLTNLLNNQGKNDEDLVKQAQISNERENILLDDIQCLTKKVNELSIENDKLNSDTHTMYKDITEIKEVNYKLTEDLKNKEQSIIKINNENKQLKGVIQDYNNNVKNINNNFKSKLNDINYENIMNISAKDKKISSLQSLIQQLNSYIDQLFLYFNDFIKSSEFNLKNRDQLNPMEMSLLIKQFDNFKNKFILSKENIEKCKRQFNTSQNEINNKDNKKYTNDINPDTTFNTSIDLQTKYDNILRKYRTSNLSEQRSQLDFSSSNYDVDSSSPSVSISIRSPHRNSYKNTQNNNNINKDFKFLSRRDINDLKQLSVDTSGAMTDNVALGSLSSDIDIDSELTRDK